MNFMVGKKVEQVVQIGGRGNLDKSKRTAAFFRENVPKRLFVFNNVNFYAYY